MAFLKNKNFNFTKKKKQYLTEKKAIIIVNRNLTEKAFEIQNLKQRKTIRFGKMKKPLKIELLEASFRINDLLTEFWEK